MTKALTKRFSIFISIFAFSACGSSEETKSSPGSIAMTWSGISQVATENKEDAPAMSGNSCDSVRLISTGFSSKQIVTLNIEGDSQASFFSGTADRSCSGPSAAPLTTQVEIEPSGSKLVYFKPGPGATSLKISASATGAGSIASVSIKVIPVILKIAYDEKVRGVAKSNVCTLIEIRTGLSTGNGSTSPDGGLNVTLTLAAASGAALFSDAQCTTQTSTVNISGPASDGYSLIPGKFYILNPVASDTATITATAPGYPAASASITFN